MAYEIHNPLHRAFVDNIRSRRLTLGLTQCEMASKLRITQGTYAAIEGGRRIPNLETIARVAKVLQVGPIELLSAEAVAARR